MKNLLLLISAIVSLNSFATNYTCKGLTTANYNVLLEVGDSFEGSAKNATLTISSDSKIVKEEKFSVQANTFRVGQTSYNYSVLELKDSAGVNSGLLVLRDASCSSRNDMHCG